MVDLAQTETNDEDRAAVSDLLIAMEPPWWQENRYREALARAYRLGKEAHHHVTT